MNDWQLTQWISQSLEGQLDESQHAQLQAALLKSPASQAFAQWTRLIQNAAAETARIESMPPDRPATGPADRLSDLSKARLQRALLTALKQSHQQEDAQLQLQVAQAPSHYAKHLADANAPETASPPSADFASWLRGGRQLRDALVADLSSTLQTLHYVVALVALTDLRNATRRVTPPDTPLKPDSNSVQEPDSGSTMRPLSSQQLASVLLSHMRVQTKLCAISIADCQRQRFEERLRLQRGPRDMFDLRSLAVDRLRQCSASAFHQAVFSANSSTPIFDLDRSIAGWSRIMLGLPLDLPRLQTKSSKEQQSHAAHRWGIAIVEVDIERMLHSHLAAANIDADMLVYDGHGRNLFSSRPQSDAPTQHFFLPTPTSAHRSPTNSDHDSSGDESSGHESSGSDSSLGWWATDELNQTGEVLRPAQGVWAAVLHCPAPLDNLQLVLHRV